MEFEKYLKKPMATEILWDLNKEKMSLLELNLYASSCDVKHNEKVEGVKCPICGKQLYARRGKFGGFIGCGGYPNCTFKAKSYYKQKFYNDEYEYSKNSWDNDNTPGLW